MQLFQFKVKFYSEHTDKTNTDYCLVFGTDISDACHNFEQAGYAYIEELTITVVNDECTPNVVYLPKDSDIMMEMRNANCY
jgi:hypothetical protein